MPFTPEKAYFAIRRGNETCKLLGNKLTDDALDTDLFFVYHAGESVKATKAMIRDGDSSLDFDNDLVAYTDTDNSCLLYTSPSPRDGLLSRMPSSA